MSVRITREPAGSDDARRRSTSAPARRARGVVAAGLVAIVGVGLWATLNPPPPRLPAAGRFQDVKLIGIDRPFPAAGRFLSDPYIGSKVCAECHPGESALQARSGHARTLRPAGRLPLARHLDGKAVDDPEVAGVRWKYRHDDGQLRVARSTADHVEECIAEYAFGSGHHATTFVSIIDPAAPTILEHRLTHYAREDVLALTPGHETRPPPPGMTPHGGVPPPRDARMCFACHATELAAGERPGIDEATMIPNVSCERCHGPGRAHVDAARRGAPESELTLPLGVGGWTSASLLQFCGECHRHPAGPRPGRIRADDPNLVRFQPIGLMQSKCFRESGGALSCLSCHDPHARASSDRASYDAACLECHGNPSAVAQGAAPTAGARGGACPVSPAGRCVECHMPRVAVDAGRHVQLSDHWIRVRRDGESARAGERTSGSPASPGH